VGPTQILIVQVDFNIIGFHFKVQHAFARLLPVAGRPGFLIGSQPGHDEAANRVSSDRPETEGGADGKGCHKDHPRPARHAFSYRNSPIKHVQQIGPARKQALARWMAGAE
jgi:hypothetical protein